MENATSFPQPPQPDHNKTTLGWVFGGLSFIPLIGVIFGIVAIVIGSKNKMKGPIALGIAGILVTVVLYGGLFYFGFVAKTGVYADLKVQLVSQEMQQLAGQIALYKSQSGKLPSNLSELGSPTPQNPIFLSDPWFNNISYTAKSDGSFVLVSAGPDKAFGTADDISRTFGERATSTPVTQATEVSLPAIDSIYPQIASVGDTLTVKGSNFDPVGGWVGNGWISNPHTFLRIKNGNDSAVLWSGNEPDDAKTTATNQIKVTIPSKVCRLSEAAIGGCSTGGYMQILPGQYNLEVDVDGRGSSNTMVLNIQVETL